MNSAIRTSAQIKDEVLRRGWKFEDLFGDGSFYKVTNNKGEWRIGRGSRLGLSNTNGMLIASDKLRSSKFIDSLGFHTPVTRQFTTYEEAKNFLKQYKPIVIKPRDAEQGRGVTMNITTDEMLEDAFNEAAKHSKKGVIGQEQLQGRQYRVLVVGNKMVAAVERRPTTVEGDGIHTVEELVAIKNQDSRRGDDEESILHPIQLENVRLYMGEEKLAAIIPKGEEVIVDPVASASRGSETYNVTDEVSEELAENLVYITQTLGLSICGFDLMAPELRNVKDQDIPLIEMNSLPGLKIHLYPTGKGPAIDPSPYIVDQAFSVGITPYNH